MEHYNMQYVSNAAFLLTVYSDHLQASNQRLRCDQGEVGPEEIFAFAKSQVDYILGANPMGMSYLVGYGLRYRQRMHQRGASIESYKENRGFIGCVHPGAEACLFGLLFGLFCKYVSLP
ncbi:Glycoside hydrolase, family 9 [Corchorus capsularis]|uniref:cellulase n=1 Tax=Corchorus capsularis TaxID=210143 RepID=A0A1R3ILV7_COCAP|nr:Glycoside hydrolase, family 9 [Corchorus capsularis]